MTPEQAAANQVAAPDGANTVPPTERAPGVTAAVAYLIYISTRNRLQRQLRRLRSPRVIAAIALVGLWLYTLLWSSSGQSTSPAPFLAGELVHHFIVLATFLGAAYYWLMGKEQRVLAFTPAEVDFLFQAPLTRRQLVTYRLLRLQLATVVSVLILSIFWRRSDRGTGEFLLHAAALWVLLSTLQLHRLAATLVRIGAVAHGRAGLARMALPLILFGVASGAVVAAFAFAWPAGGLTSFADLGTWLSAAMDSTVARVALFPARIAVAPWYSQSTGEWLRTIGPALVLLAIHVTWVIRTDAAFEEAAVNAAAARARAVKAIATGAPSPGSLARRISARIPLAPVGFPTAAIVWKNTIAALRGGTVFPAFVLLPAITVILLLFRNLIPTPLGEALTAMLVLWMLATIVLGPLWVRNDLRRDLLKLEVVQAWPLRGATVVGASLLSSALIITLLTLLAGVAAFSAGGATLMADLGTARTAAAVIALVVALPVLSLLGTLVHNGAALLFPAWMHLGPDRPGGIEAIGQLYLTMFISIVAMAILALLPVLTAGLVVYVLSESLGPWSWPLAAAAAVPVVLAQVWLLTQWLGEVLERTEPHAVGQS